ncbi:hypothetical protein [Lichenibacterium dinghuense]|uniref:hypothetical protein n=1 Tax=Lichenibacterium dinghuense TaxID=2895977 RepID=UPI001F31440D|nr:hypothetical protein [Lichenibacterium sp. 6Y81]
MRVLVCVAHYVPRSGPRHRIEGSSQESPDARAVTVTFCLRQWSSLVARRHFLLGTDFDLDPEMAGLVEPVENAVSGSVYVCVNGDNHLLDQLSSVKVHTVRQPVGNPRHLPYVCRQIFVRFLGDYDLFVYAEDDTVPLDPGFFARYAAFDREFGPAFVLLPNRYELFSAGAHKVYLEFPSPNGYRVASPEPGPAILTMRDGTELERTNSPYAGCFAVTREQLRAWAAMPFFDAPTAEFDANVLEQAMIPMFGRRPVYRPSRRNVSALEVQHVSGRNSHASTPGNRLIGHLNGTMPD